MVNILVYTELSFNFNCGGIVVQYELCKILDSLGHNVRIKSPTNDSNSIFCKYYNNEFDMNETIVIYGETISGNPLKAPYVVRWILAPLGIIGESKKHTWCHSDLVYYFNYDKIFFHNEHKVGKIYKTLSSIHFNSIINNYNKPGRKGYCHTFRKIQFHKQLKFAHPPRYSLEITSSHKLLDIVSIFNKKDIFISYDPLTFLNIIAALCGCVSVVIKIDNMNEEDWLKTTVAYQYMKDNNLTKLYGIAYGISEISWARNTLHLVKEQWNSIIEYLKTNTIIPFINDVENLNNFKSLENTVQNNFS